MILILFDKNYIFGGKMDVAAKGSGSSRPDQNFDPLGKPFGSTVISKTFFKNLGPEPLAPYHAIKGV